MIKESIKVLYVEDETFLGKIVQETLQSKGFEVSMVADGQKAFENFVAFKPDICLLDIMLPNKDGYEIATEIRQVDEQAPIIFLTAKSQTEDVLEGFKTGGNDYIKKPFSVEELVARMHNLLQLKGKQAPTAADAYTIGALTFNESRQTLSGQGGEKKLSYREAELLKYILSRRNSIIDRRDLLNAIWGNDNFFNSRNLDVYITKLRGYLKEDPSLEIITIKGVGYRFVAG